MKTISRSNKNLAPLFVLYAIDLVLLLFLRSKNNNKKTRRRVFLFSYAQTVSLRRIQKTPVVIPSYAEKGNKLRIQGKKAKAQSNRRFDKSWFLYAELVFLSPHRKG